MKKNRGLAIVPSRLSLLSLVVSFVTSIFSTRSAAFVPNANSLFGSVCRRSQALVLWKQQQQQQAKLLNPQDNPYQYLRNKAKLRSPYVLQEEDKCTPLPTNHQKDASFDDRNLTPSDNPSRTLRDRGPKGYTPQNIRRSVPWDTKKDLNFRQGNLTPSDSPQRVLSDRGPKGYSPKFVDNSNYVNWQTRKDANFQGRNLNPQDLPYRTLDD